nr:integrase, catalytic region, zinc finger, CCHC-type, peptidase aspartic, catalytic [Tanacetum cinerariifolium]
VSSASGSQSKDNTKNNRIRQTLKKAKVTELEDHPRKVKSSLNKASVVDSRARRTFTLVGNVCPLTRIATATIVPPREPIPIVQSTDKPVVTLVYTRKPKAKNVPNKVEPNKSWGSSSNVSTSITDCRLSKSSFGQFCDSDLEVAFRQHTCFIRNLEGVDLLTGSRGNNLYTLSLQDMMASSPICTVKFGNDHVAKIIGYGEYQIGNVTISQLFANILALFAILQDMMASSPICLLSKVRLSVPIRRIRTDNGTEFVNQTLRDYYKE